MAIFQLTELNIKANPPCFARARAHVHALTTRKSCTVEMRNVILRNYLKLEALKTNINVFFYFKMSITRFSTNYSFCVIAMTGEE